MFKRALQYGAALIAIYLIVDNGTNSGRVMSSAGSAGSQLIAAFQGRSK